jgi:hypothetical protein
LTRGGDTIDRDGRPDMTLRIEPTDAKGIPY